MKDVEQKLSVQQAMDMLKVEIESGRSSEIMRLLAARHRNFAVKSGLSKDMPEALSTRLWDTITMKAYDNENEVHRLQALATEVAVMDEIRLRVPNWQLVIRLTDPPIGEDWRCHPLMHSYLDRTLLFSTS